MDLGAMEKMIEFGGGREFLGKKRSEVEEMRKR